MLIVARKKKTKQTGLMENKLTNPNQTIFEKIKRLDENKNEYWTARDLSKVLEYSEFRHFKSVIDRAKEACKNSGFTITDHFEDILGMVSIGSGAARELGDIKLSRYACYLIVQNADPSKEIVANLFCHTNTLAGNSTNTSIATIKN